MKSFRGEKSGAGPLEYSRKREAYGVDVVAIIL